MSEKGYAGKIRVLVLGGAGFIGRHAVTALLSANADVAIGTRHPARLGLSLPAQVRDCPRHEVYFEDMTDPGAWRTLASKYDVILNCVGILRPRGRASYDRVHHLAPAALAHTCGRHRTRLIHISALGLDDRARSGFLRSKLAGERALLASGADATIVRPSLLDGEGGFGATWLRRLARMPVHVLPADSLGKIAVLDARDLGEALASLAMDKTPFARTRPAEIELGGNDSHTLREYLAALRHLKTPRSAPVLSIPSWLARLTSHLCDLLHFSPYSFGHWELMRKDNCPSPNWITELLGRAPRPVGAGTVTQSEASAPFRANASSTVFRSPRKCSKTSFKAPRDDLRIADFIPKAPAPHMRPAPAGPEPEYDCSKSVSLPGDNK